MIEIDPTDKTTQAQLLVGRFLYYWAFLEAEINTSLGKALGLTSAETFIVTRNMAFQSKVNVLKTFINFQGNSKWGIALTKALSEAAGLAESARNIIAHEPFGVSDDGQAVEFIRIVARGELKFPEIIWTPAKFNDAYEQMEVLGRTLADNIPNVELLRAAVAANLRTVAPAGGLFGLGTFPQSPTVQGLLGSSPFNPQSGGSGTPDTDSPSDLAPKDQ
jgi:hypothetical protein